MGLSCKDNFLLDALQIDFRRDSRKDISQSLFEYIQPQDWTTMFGKILLQHVGRKKTVRIGRTNCGEKKNCQDWPHKMWGEKKLSELATQIVGRKKAIRIGRTNCGEKKNTGFLAFRCF
ncbi:MAG: hypothetical protein NW226_07370 [Microscillaceae bacterium]|nr:hypothetical protein [Microscillaceae bacterium]